MFALYKEGKQRADFVRANCQLYDFKLLFGRYSINTNFYSVKIILRDLIGITDMISVMDLAIK